MKVRGSLTDLSGAKKLIKKGVKVYIARPGALISLIVLERKGEIVLTEVSEPRIGNRFDHWKTDQPWAFYLASYLPPLGFAHFSLFTNFWFAYAHYQSKPHGR